MELNGGAVAASVGLGAAARQRLASFRKNVFVMRAPDSR